MRFVLLATVAALALPAPAGAARWPQYWAPLTTLASQIAGHPVDIYCEAQEEWSFDGGELGPGTLGYTWFDDATTPRYIALGPFACGGALLLLSDPNETSGITSYYDREAVGLLALIHESIHVRDRTRDEALVECRTMREFSSVAARLNVSSVNIERLSKAARDYDATLAPMYHGAPC